MDVIELEINSNCSNNNCNHNHNNCNNNNTVDNCLDKLPLARAYVPSQRFNKVYPMCEALKVGTIFPELDLRYKKPDPDYRPQRLC